ncbi:MAG TPA: hypothetical protein VK956_08695 [Verrucomicrobium sp.]|nr:hypothetical protein [Verrucomicrobium sp.]
MDSPTPTPEQTVSAYLNAMREQAQKFKALADNGKISGLAQMTLLMQEASMVAEDYWLHPERSFAGGSVGWAQGGDGVTDAATIPTFTTREVSDTCADVEVALLQDGQKVAADAYRLQLKDGRWWIEGQLARKATSENLFG